MESINRSTTPTFKTYTIRDDKGEFRLMSQEDVSKLVRNTMAKASSEGGGGNHQGGLTTTTKLTTAQQYAAASDLSRRLTLSPRALQRPTTASTTTTTSATSNRGGRGVSYSPKSKLFQDFRKAVSSGTIPSDLRNDNNDDNDHKSRTNNHHPTNNTSSGVEIQGMIEEGLIPKSRTKREDRYTSLVRSVGPMAIDRENDPQDVSFTVSTENVELQDTAMAHQRVSMLRAKYNAKRKKIRRNKNTTPSSSDVDEVSPTIETTTASSKAIGTNKKYENNRSNISKNNKKRTTKYCIRHEQQYSWSTVEKSDDEDYNVDDLNDDDGIKYRRPENDDDVRDDVEQIIIEYEHQNGNEIATTTAAEEIEVRIGNHVDDVQQHVPDVLYTSSVKEATTCNSKVNDGKNGINVDVVNNEAGISQGVVTPNIVDTSYTKRSVGLDFNTLLPPKHSHVIQPIDVSEEYHPSYSTFNVSPQKDLASLSNVFSGESTLSDKDICNMVKHSMAKAKLTRKEITDLLNDTTSPTALSLSDVGTTILTTSSSYRNHEKGISSSITTKSLSPRRRRPLTIHHHLTSRIIPTIENSSIESTNGPAANGEVAVEKTIVEASTELQKMHLSIPETQLEMLPSEKETEVIEKESDTDQLTVPDETKEKGDGAHTDQGTEVPSNENFEMDDPNVVDVSVDVVTEEEKPNTDLVQVLETTPETPPPEEPNDVKEIEALATVHKKQSNCCCFLLCCAPEENESTTIELNQSVATTDPPQQEPVNIDVDEALVPTPVTTQHEPSDEVTIEALVTTIETPQQDPPGTDVVETLEITSETPQQVSPSLETIVEAAADPKQQNSCCCFHLCCSPIILTSSTEEEAVAVTGTSELEKDISTKQEDNDEKEQQEDSSVLDSTVSVKNEESVSLCKPSPDDKATPTQVENCEKMVAVKDKGNSSDEVLISPIIDIVKEEVIPDEIVSEEPERIDEIECKVELPPAGTIESTPVDNCLDIPMDTIGSKAEACCDKMDHQQPAEIIVMTKEEQDPDAQLESQKKEKNVQATGDEEVSKKKLKRLKYKSFKEYYDIKATITNEFLNEVISRKGSKMSVLELAEILNSLQSKTDLEETNDDHESRTVNQHSIGEAGTVPDDRSEIDEKNLEASGWCGEFLSLFHDFDIRDVDDEYGSASYCQDESRAVTWMESTGGVASKEDVTETAGANNSLYEEEEEEEEEEQRSKVVIYESEGGTTLDEHDCRRLTFSFSYGSSYDY